MGTLDGVGHGTALGGRYRLEERLAAGREAATWRAVDQRLERTVGVRVVGGPAAEDTLDAARRAAVVEDTRLLRILDVGTEPVGTGTTAADVTYVVTEHLRARSLTAVLREDGPLDAEQVRAVVGEAAQALERARLAGLHHRRITTDSILRTPSGDVKVTGLAVEAAAAGVDDEDDVTAARQDAVALVAVLYAGLTGRWPLGTGPGLEPAPLVAGIATPPADLVSGVPNDLDTLCVVTFGPHEDGPRTPGELAAELAPWGADRSGQLPPVPAGRPGQPPARPAARFPVRLAAGAAGSAGAAGAAGTEALWGGDDDAAYEPPVPARPEPRGEPVVGAPQAAAAQDLTPGWNGPADDDGDPFPFEQAIGTGEYAEPPRGAGPVQKLVLVGVAVALLLGLVIAVNSLAGIGGDDDGNQAADRPTATETVTAEEPAPTDAAPSQPQPQPPAGEPPAIAGVQTLDPQGDQTENDDSAPDAVDGDPRSFWSSSTYKTADFGGLKDGVGIVVQLAAPVPVSGVTLQLNGSGGSFELRTAPGPGLGGSQVVATGTVTGQPVDLALEQPVETQHLIVWFTELPTTDAGFRIELAEVAVR